MDKLISSQHMGLINMIMVHKAYHQFKDRELHAIGINPKRNTNKEVLKFTKYYEAERERERKDYTIFDLAQFYSHWHMLDGKLASKYTVFSDGKQLYGLAGFLDKAPFEPKLFILGEGTMRQYEYATINLPLSTHWLQIWSIELHEFFQGRGKLIDKFTRGVHENPDIYKHIITQAEFKQFCQRCEMLELLNV